MATRAAQADRAELADRATAADGLRGVVRKSLEYTIPSGFFDVVQVGVRRGDGAVRRRLDLGGGLGHPDRDQLGPTRRAEAGVVELADLDLSTAPLHGTVYAICVPVDGA